MTSTHTATQLRVSHFTLAIDGRPASRDQVLPSWEPHDRLGVVVHEHYGVLGAAHLVQLAITAFYDVRPARRAGKLEVGDPLALYPEIYVFHVGGSYGDHRWLDVFPSRKEVRLEPNASAVLEALNDRAITRLAVPDGHPAPVEHRWKEPAAARDRIRSVFAYDPGGRTAGADVDIAGQDPVTEFNVLKILETAATDPAAETARTRARARRARLTNGGAAATESYRRIDLYAALAMLCPVVDGR